MTVQTCVSISDGRPKRDRQKAATQDEPSDGRRKIQEAAELKSSGHLVPDLQ